MYWSLMVIVVQVFQLKVDGVAFRLIPEVSQIKNAISVSIYSIFMFTNMFSRLTLCLLCMF